MGSETLEESEDLVSQRPEPSPRTFFDSGAVFEGTLRLSGDFRIDSEFRGDLTTDGSIVVGPAGCVEGNIHARQVEIEGAVAGNVTARRMLVLRASGRLHGDVETACLEVERHAFFQGGTKMIQPLSNTRSSVEASSTAANAHENPGSASNFVPS